MGGFLVFPIPAVTFNFTFSCNPKAAVHILAVMSFLLFNGILIGNLEALNVNILFYKCNIGKRRM
jgi:hypothetical protein